MPRSKLAIVDVDGDNGGDNGGETSWTTPLSLFGAHPEDTLAARTGGGSRHFYIASSPAHHQDPDQSSGAGIGTRGRYDPTMWQSGGGIRC
jgi:hypothetical protein